MSGARNCTRWPCRRTTKHPSGRCFDHRTGDGPKSGPMIPAPTSSGVRPWVSHRGEGKARTEKWSDGYGDPNREGNPNEVDYDQAGNVTEEKWVRFELPTRLDGPAVIEHARGNPPLRIEKWFLDGVPHRADGPAEEIYREDDGTLRAEHFYADGVKHRVGAPASIGYGPDGSVEAMNFYDRGILSRIEGPAVEWADGSRGFHLRMEVLRDPSGLSGNGGTEICAVPFQSHAKLLAAVRELPDAEIRNHLAASALAPLLDEGITPDTLLTALESGVRTPEGVRHLLDGAPAEWVAAWEEGTGA